MSCNVPLNIPEELEKRLYQLVINRLNGDLIHYASYRRTLLNLVKKGIGGFIIFGGARGEIRDFIGELQSLADVPLFIASDIERGVGQQIKGANALPCPMAIAAALDRGSPEDALLLENALKGVADEAIDNGINLPLIPVLDVNQDPDNPIICTRAFSDNPETVSWFGSEYIRILERAGLISCAKHFPGHGDTAVDSHIALPVIKKSRRELNSMDLIPFIEAIKTGVSSIMVGHLAVPSLDERPASLSKKIIHGLLREELGFKGLVLTDALDMSALSSAGEAPVKCINAGADILLHPTDADAAAALLLSAVESGEIDEMTVNNAAGRIMTAKERLRRMTPGEADYGTNRGWSSRITEKAVTLVKHAPGLLPLTETKDVRLVVAGDFVLPPSAPLRRYLPPASAPHDITAAAAETLIFALFTSVAAWKGSSGLAGEDRDKIAGLIKRAGKAIVISFGSPYILRYFGDADILIAAFEPTDQAQETVIKCLKGEMDFMGRLPVRLAHL
ncbi:MAG TPA: glycoside hydrolase family 3 N-terminal domain-containing protein [Dissulfurispiraceae bacterium]|nr:glycoside hydrolase family 3 N-terminal domain-containing protein [Dissulfurispiraceae bacterium]